MTSKLKLPPTDRADVDAEQLGAVIHDVPRIKLNEPSNVRIGLKARSCQLKSKRTAAGVQQKIRILAKRMDAEPPTLPLPTYGMVHMQFVRDDGRCWESTFDNGDTVQNDGKKFTAKKRKRK